ncbi:MAG TPA: tRNA (adenosine(37)-N6)-threonylcarbamoyltransferase complex dimerization subunit type 1 TsaB [Ktedonobacterales bacterium]
MLLVMDTSTQYASVALSHQDTLLASVTWLVENRHSAELLLRVNEVLSAARVAPGRLEAIGVALGPGSFNGVRAGVATAKGLSLALSAPIVGVPTLDIIGWGARLAPEEVWSLLDAGRGEVYAAAYDTAGAAPSTWAPRAFDAGDGHGLASYHILTPAALAACARDGATLAGEARIATRAMIEAELGGRANTSTLAEPRSGAWLAALAQARLDAGRPDTPESLEPLYLRRPAITHSERPDITALSNGAQPADGAKGERLAL